MTDLFFTSHPKRDQLKLWLKKREFVKTSEVVAWGLENFHIRAERDCRDFAGEGLIRRLTDQEKAFRGYGKTVEDVWMWI